MVGYSVIYPDGHTIRGEANLPTTPGPGLALLKRVVLPYLGEGEPMEHVSVLYNGGRADMFVAEMGHMALTTRPPMPPNPVATSIYRAAWMAHHPGDNPSDLPEIAGPAVLFDKIVWT